MKKIAAWILILSSIFLVYQCVEKDKCIQFYHIQLNGTIEDVQDTVSLGDTLWYEMRLGEMLFDTISQSWIPRNEESFPLYFTATKLDSNRYYNAEEMFEYYPIYGEITFERLSQFTYVIIQTHQLNSERIIRFGFKAKEKGIFLTSPLVLRKDFEDLLIGDQKCRSFVKGISFQINQENDLNGYPLLAASNNPEHRNISEDAYKKAGGFAFVVVD
jgi:hypothetical protein